MDNAAARFLRILQKVKEINGDVACKQAWETILPMKPDTDIIESLGKLMTLSGIAARLVMEAHPDEADAVRHWKRAFHNGFHATALSSKWSEFSKHIDNHTINYLKSHARLLDYTRTQREVSEDSLSEIKNLVIAAKEELLSSDLSLKIKTLLNERLSDIISSIEDYQIHGFDDVFDRANIVIAQIVQLPDEDRKSLKSSKAGEKIAEAMSAITKTAEAISASLSLGNAITKLLGNN